jgi:DNA-binding PadR family transcriptional regulator
MRHRNRGPFEGLGQGGGRKGGRDESGGQSESFGQHHPHGHRDREGHGRRGGPGRGRAQRGDVRTAILQVLADEPMHGYQIMQTMRDRTAGAWRPSPGAVYPTIAQLEDEGLVTTREDGGRRLVTLTPEGTAYLEERSARLGDPFADFAEGTSGPDLRDPLHELQAAVRQIAVGGNPTQLEAAARVLAQAKRSLYLILAGEPEEARE